MEKLDEAMEILRSSGYFESHDEQTASLILGRFFAKKMSDAKDLEAYIKRIFGLDGKDKAEIYLKERFGKKYGVFVAHKRWVCVYVDRKYILSYDWLERRLNVVGGYDSGLLGTALGLLPWPNNIVSRMISTVYEIAIERSKKDDKPATSGDSGRDGESNVRSMDESKKESEKQAKRFVKPRGW